MNEQEKSNLGLQEDLLQGREICETIDWCEGCHTLREELSKVKTEHELNYTALKEKIISTDLLIKKYTSKCQECDIQSKKAEELHKQLEQYRRDCELLESKLKTVLQEAEPLKQTKERLEVAQRLQQHEIQNLRDKLESSEASHKMYSAARINQEEKVQEVEDQLKESREKNRDLEISNKKQHATITKLQGELKKDKGAQNKQLISERTAKKNLEKRVNYLERLLQNHGVPQSIIQCTKAVRTTHRTPGRGRRKQVENEPRQPTLPGSDVSSDEELLLTKLIEDEDSDGEGIGLFRPIEHALSPLPPSPPSFEEEGSEDSVDDMVEVLENVLNSPGPTGEKKNLIDRPPRTRGRPPRRAARRRGNPGPSKLIHDGVDIINKQPETEDLQSMRVVESGLSSEGVLTLQESLSDSEHETQQDMPFQEFGQDQTLRADLQLSASSTSESESDSSLSPSKSPQRSARKKRGSGRAVSVTIQKSNAERVQKLPERRRTRSMSQESSSGSELSDGSCSPGASSPKVASPRIQQQSASPFKKPLPVSPRRRGRPARATSCRAAEVSPSSGNASNVVPDRRVTRSVSCPSEVNEENIRDQKQEEAPPVKSKPCAKETPKDQSDSHEGKQETVSVVIPTPTRKRAHTKDEVKQETDRTMSESPVAKTPCVEETPQNQTEEDAAVEKQDESEEDRPKEFGSVVAAFMHNLKSAFQKTVKTKQTNAPTTDPPVNPTIPVKPTRKASCLTAKAGQGAEKESKRNKLVAMKGITRLQSSDEPSKSSESPSGSEPPADSAKLNRRRDNTENVFKPVSKTESLEVLSESLDHSRNEQHRPLSKTKSTGFIMQSLDVEGLETEDQSSITDTHDDSGECITLKLDSQVPETEGETSGEVKVQPTKVPQLTLSLVKDADGDEIMETDDTSGPMQNGSRPSAPMVVVAEVHNIQVNQEDNQCYPEKQIRSPTGKSLGQSTHGLEGTASADESRPCTVTQLPSPSMPAQDDVHTTPTQPNHDNSSQKNMSNPLHSVPSEQKEKDTVSDAPSTLDIPADKPIVGENQSEGKSGTTESSLPKDSEKSLPLVSEDSSSSVDSLKNTPIPVSRGTPEGHPVEKSDELGRSSTSKLTLSSSEKSPSGNSPAPEDGEEDPLSVVKGRATLRRQFSVDAGKRGASDMSDKGVNLRTKFVGASVQQVDQEEKKDIFESVQVLTLSGVNNDVKEQRTNIGSSPLLGQDLVSRLSIEPQGQEPSGGGIKAAKSATSKPTGEEDQEEEKAQSISRTENIQMIDQQQGCNVAADGMDVGEGGSQAGPSVPTRPTRPTSLQYRPSLIAPGTSRAPSRSPVTPDTDLPVSFVQGPSGRSETLRTPSVMSESPMSSLPPSPMEKVECITPLSPMLPSDQSDALSPLSFTLSDTEDIGNPISPLPPSPVPMLHGYDGDDLESQHDERRSPAEAGEPSVSHEPSPSPTEPTPGPSPLLCPIKNPSAAESWDKLPVPEKVPMVDESLPPMHQPKARVAHRTAQQPRPPPPVRKPTPPVDQPTKKSVKGKATPGLPRKSSKAKSQPVHKDQNLESADPTSQAGDVSSQQEPAVKRKPGRPAKRKSKDSSTTCPATAKVKREGSTEDAAHPVGGADAGVRVTPLTGASAVSSAHSELLVLVRRRTCDVQSVAMRLYRHATPAGQQAVIKAIIKLCKSQEIDLLSTLFMLCSKSATKLAGWKPFMADHEVKITQLLCYLSDTPEFEGIVDALVEEASGVVLRPDAASVLVRASLCRICTALCRQKGLAGRMRVLLYDVIVTQVTGFPTITVAVASVWPQLLQRTISQGPQALIGGLEHVVMKRVAGDKLRLTKLAACLRALCQWEVPAQDWADSRVFVTDTLNLLKTEASRPTPSKDALCELEQTLVLVACTEDWTWTNNVLVVECLWPQLRAWAGAQTKGTGCDISHSLCESLIRVMGLVVSRCPAALTSAARDVIAMMKPLVLGVPGTTIPAGVQHAALESLLRLAPFDTQTVADVTDTWAGQNLRSPASPASTITHAGRRSRGSSVASPEHSYLQGLISHFVRAYTEVLPKDKFTNLASFK